MADSGGCGWLIWWLWRYRLGLRTHILFLKGWRPKSDALTTLWQFARTNSPEENRSSNSELTHPPEAWPNPPENTPLSFHHFITICLVIHHVLFQEFNQFYHIFTPSLGLATWWCLSRHLAHLTPWWRAILCVDVSTAQTLPRRKWQRARLRWNVVAMLHERSNVLHSISWCASGFSPSPIQSPVSGYKLG